MLFLFVFWFRSYGSDSEFPVPHLGDPPTFRRCPFRMFDTVEFRWTPYVKYRIFILS